MRESLACDESTSQSLIVRVNEVTRDEGILSTLACNKSAGYSLLLQNWEMVPDLLRKRN